MKRFLTILCILLAVTNSIYGTHINGVQLRYEYIGRNSSNQMQYRVVLDYYRDCPAGSAGMGAGMAVTLNPGNHIYPLKLDSPSCYFGCELSTQCSNIPSGCLSGPFPSTLKFIFSDTITLPYSYSDWRISFTDGTRNNTISNLQTPGSQDLYIEAVINNDIDPITGVNFTNNSSVFQNDPVPAVCKSQNAPIVYNASSTDIDGDSLVYSFVSPFSSSNTSIPYATGYTASDPISSRFPCLFDSSTGLLTFSPYVQEVDVLAFQVREYRHGVLIGSTMRDVNLNIYSCNAVLPEIGTPSIIQEGYLVDSTSINACKGNDLIFDIPISVASGVNITLESSVDLFPSAYNGFHFSQIGSGDHVKARIEWLNVDTGCRYITVGATASDCPVKTRAFKVLKVCSKKGVQIFADPSVSCGEPVSLSATGGTNPHWSSSQGIANSNSLFAQTLPGASSWYYYQSDCGADSVFVKVSRSISHTIDTDTTVCKGNEVQLGIQMNTPGVYTYSWEPAAGLHDAANNPTSSIPDPRVFVFDSQTYRVVVTDTSGCKITDTVNVYARGGAPFYISGDTSITLGARVNLNVYSTATSLSPCSIYTGSNLTSTTHFQVGTNTTVQVGAGSAYPSIYGAAYKSARHQMLFRASELNALFNGNNIITSLKFFIGTFNTSSMMSNFTIKIACVNADSLTGYMGNGSLTTVYGPVNYTPFAGSNTHVFNQPYVWDGVSDLVIDICFENQAVGSINNKLVYTTTPFRSMWWTYNNYPGGACNYTGTQAVAPFYADFFRRPNVDFEVTREPFTVNAVTWSPSTGINAVNSAHATSTFATPTSNQWYVFSSADSVCPRVDSIHVSVLGSTNRVILPSRDTIVCGAGSLIKLYAPIAADTFRWRQSGYLLSNSDSLSYTVNQSANIVLSMRDTSGTEYIDTFRIILNEKVWPGDVNSDQSVDNSDILYLGIAYGAQGPVRPNASNAWIGQCVVPWSSSFFFGVNYAHADCNGDSTVNDDDTLAINTNFFLTHPKNQERRQGSNLISVSTDKSHYSINDTIRATITMGSNSSPVNGVYGVAYKLNSSSLSSIRVINTDQSRSWLAPGIKFKKIDSGNLYLAQTRIDHIDTSGYGTIASLTLVVDSVSDLADTLYLDLSVDLALNKNGDSLYFTNSSSPVTLTKYPLGINDLDIDKSISLYPNPNSGSFVVSNDLPGKVALTLIDALGRVVFETTLSERLTTIQTSNLSSGVYTALFKSEMSVCSRRVVIN